MTTWTWFLLALGCFLLIQGVITMLAMLRMRQRRLKDERYRRSERRTEEQWRKVIEERRKEDVAR